MKTIGLIGGMSWESTTEYYKAINTFTKNRLGGLHSAKILLYSVDFAEIENLQASGNWDKAGEILAEAAQNLEGAGADFLLICTNTMHKVADHVESSTNIPLLHIADATAHKLREDGITKVGLLGTAFTMEQDFYKARLETLFDIEVIVPAHQERIAIHDIIYKELCLGVIKQSSKKTYLDIVEQLALQGAQGVILGCTEIAMLIQQQDTPTVLYDTAIIHAEAAVVHANNR